MNYPALIFWILIAWSVTASRDTLLVLMIASMPFASLALVPPEITGMSILPQSMFAVVLILKVVAPQLMPLSAKLMNALRFRNLGFLALFLLVGTIVTMFMPKLFGGEVVIQPMRDVSGAPDLLTSTTQNFTQFGYITLSVMIVFAVTLLTDEPGFTKSLLTSVFAGGLVCILTGLIDLAAAWAGMESLLKPFRNADYAYLTTVEIAGQKRVVGFTPEASAYGPICVDFATAIALLRTLYAEGRQRILATYRHRAGRDGAALNFIHCLSWFGGIGSGLRSELGQARGVVFGVWPTRACLGVAGGSQPDRRAGVHFSRARRFV